MNELQFMGLLFFGVATFEMIQYLFNKDMTFYEGLQNDVCLKVFCLLALVFLLTACGKDGIARVEYFVNDEWRTCAQPVTEPCGMTLICGDSVFQCVTNVQSR